MDSFMVTLNPDKLLKEEFVSNLTGSSLLEIAALSTIFPLFFVLRRSVLSTRSTDDVPNGLCAFLVIVIKEFFFTLFPIILVLTVLSHWLYACTIMLLLLVMLTNRFGPRDPWFSGSISHRDHLTSYRVIMTIMTCLCILAVDFRIFPRRFAKAEGYGSGFMDLGVGSFTLGNALVSLKAKGVSKGSWKAAIRFSIPLILLGISRLVSTRSVNYQVHVGEYGMHWNFFLTLAAVSILTSIINVPVKYSGIFGLSILVGYQSLLISGFNMYLLSDERGATIISQNKEGIFSIFGYWGLYLVGVWLGNYLFFESGPSGFRSSNAAKTRVWSLSLMFWLVTVILDRHIEKISRRMCNLSYVTLVLAENLQVLAIFMLSDSSKGSKLLKLEEAFNRNLLGLFLLANLLTGLINLSLETLSASSLLSLFIVVTYAFTLSLVAGMAHYCGFRVKFW